MLDAAIRFLKSQAANKETLNLAVKVLSALEKGNTAINLPKSISNSERLENHHISQNGKQGYFVLANGKAGLRRYFNFEKFIQSEFLDSEIQKPDINKVNQAIKKLIPTLVSDHDTDWQWQAAITLLFHKRMVLSGGPGTGKTTTLLRMIHLHQEAYGKQSIGLAAPTGKAAHRMLQSLRQNADIEKNDKNSSSELKAQTLHQLLGYNPKTQRLKFNQTNHLPYDLIFVDEASMLDVTMTHGLLQALKPKAKLVLIGDKNQLPAIEAGNVFSDLCQLLKSNKKADNLALKLKNNQAIATQTLSKYIELKHNFRFIDSPEISQLCEDVLQKSLNPKKAFYNSQHLFWSHPQTIEERLNELTKWYQLKQEGETCMILSATNFGQNSVDQMNKICLKLDKKEDWTFFQDMPIIITKNQHSLGLSNGDIGSIKWIENKWLACFAGNPINIPADSLKHWQLAYAISIHKSQGSEYDHVLITLPQDQDIQLLDQALLYTAVSRATKTVTIWGEQDFIDLMINRSQQRCTFLNNNRDLCTTHETN